MGADAHGLLDTARGSLSARDWPAARQAFESARERGVVLSAEDLYALADACWWMGRVDEALAAYQGSHEGFLDDGDTAAAASAALDIAVNHFLRGDEAAGSAWFSRVQRLLRDAPECPVHGYVAFLLEVEGPLGGIRPGGEADAEAIAAAARRIQALGHRHGDDSLVAVATMGEGRALVKAARVEEGLGLLDEAMLAVRTEHLDPKWAGNVYCHLMSAAYEIADIGRAVRWTEATTRWLEQLPVALLFTGICRVHRSQVHQLTGAWDRAEGEAIRVGEELAGIQPASAAEGHYQVGEIRRLRGDVAGAEDAYAQAHRLGRDPQPGLALLRLAQGRAGVAWSAIRAALIARAGDPLGRARLCAAGVEIAVAADELPAAAELCDELADTATAYGTTGLRVMAVHARGTLTLAAQGHEQALPLLRDACQGWRDLGAAHTEACARVLLASAYDALGDADAAARERAVAAATFEQLGAGPDLARCAPQPHEPRADGLTSREIEVLACVAAGRSNREVAAELVISEKTVARHLSNIFTKLGVASRTEAAAYAFSHDLVPPSP
ncbi:LuxR family transcriptional regulator [Egibacter rhizosphaerae]|uniref:LuxR family transcriptional regulator n=1 Tax=Egibacter rhizosphaerae TaxID=1670831 RepID=A0A411YI68_9ACTN|nr:helix-turn-helix transcriptional regulator [Egibacter rhizosphaerae]QBI20796.1 LuxR family transcriptional regulator [Egibacter rhizosphaerae]